MSINSEKELDLRIHSFMERKLNQFPEIAEAGEREHDTLLVRVQNNVSDLFRPAPRRAH